jgi:hypothetical protein
LCSVVRVDRERLRSDAAQGDVHNKKISKINEIDAWHSAC